MRKSVKQIIEGVEITSVAAEGNAMALVNGMVLFVPEGIPGDIVKVQITRKRRSYMEGYIIEITQPSPLRIPPFCSHFGECGGCKWQSLPYEKQLFYKQQQVIDQLQRIGHLELPEPCPILGSEFTREYRNKLEYTFSNKRWITRKEVLDGQSFDAAPGLGFHITGMFDKVLDIDHCYLQREPSNAIRLAIKQYALEHNLSFFDLRAQTGFLRTLVIRTNQSGDTMLTVVFAHDNPDAGEDDSARKALLEFIANKFPEITSLNYVINTKRNDSYSDLPVVLYKGQDAIYEKMENLSFKIGPKSFYQTNPTQAYRLYSKVRELAGLKGGELVYDLYTGTGTIALFLASSARFVIGIEYVPEAIEDARENASINKLDNTRFYAGDMKDILTDDFIAREGRPDVIIADPPRGGMHSDVVAAILRAAPKRIVYVSCNPATQARDLEMMKASYKIAVVQSVDMFPHTHHVENIVLAERIDETE